MSDLMRKEFDEAFRKRFGFGRMTASANADADQMLKAAEWAWQASRECLVIELPKTAGLDRMASDMSMQEIREDNRFNRALDLAKKTLTAAGVKTK